MQWDLRDVIERKFRNSTFSILVPASAVRVSDNFSSPHGDSRWGRDKWLHVPRGYQYHEALVNPMAIHWGQNVVNLTTLLSWWQLMVPPVTKKLSNWRSFVFSVLERKHNRDDIEAEKKMVVVLHWDDILKWNDFYHYVLKIVLLWFNLF